MRKTLPLLFAFLLSANTIFAAFVDGGYAVQIAQNFYTQTAGKTVKLNLAYVGLNTTAGNGLSVGTTLYYAFNVDGGKGFVIVSADDRVKPVLAYSTDQSFVIQKAPPVITGWLEKYSNQIAYIKTHLTSATPDIAVQWNNLYNNSANNTKQLRAGGAVAPLLTTTWDQDLYYNADCPSDANSPQGYGGNVPTGCGATAMSQIMRYWSYPPQGTGSNSYASNYGTLSSDFASHTYTWANMPNSVTAPNADVATIMFDCGVAVDMMYSANESSSYILSGGGVPASCQAAYTTNFGYNPNTIQGLQRANYADADWLNYINTELAASRPIQYAGQGPQGGHTFVLDGSDGNGNFHINWGWSGDDNGYYSIDAMTPGPDANGDYSQGEQMLIGIEPLNVTPVASGIDLDAAITVNPNPIAFDQTFTVTSAVINDGSSAFNGSVCAALFNSTGTFIRYIGDILSTNGNALQPASASNVTFNDTTSAVTIPGTYYVGLYYQPAGSNIWTLVGASTYINPLTVEVSDPLNSNISLYSAITASPTTFYQGQAASVNVNLTNNGGSTFFGSYEAVLLDLDGNYVESIGTYTESNGLQANYHYDAPYITFTTNNITVPEGQYILAIAEEEQGTSNWYYCGGQSYQNPVLIYVTNPGFQVSVNKVSVNTLKVYPNPASNNVTIDAGEARGNYTLKIFNTVGQLVSETNGILDGQALSADVSEFASGMYVVELKTESGTLNAKVVVK